MTLHVVHRSCLQVTRDTVTNTSSVLSLSNTMLKSTDSVRVLTCDVHFFQNSFRVHLIFTFSRLMCTYFPYVLCVHIGFFQIFCWCVEVLAICISFFFFFLSPSLMHAHTHMKDRNMDARTQNHPFSFILYMLSDNINRGHVSKINIIQSLLQMHKRAKEDEYTPTDSPHFPRGRKKARTTGVCMTLCLKTLLWFQK